ncbi:MAG: hypothetical protein FWF44_07535, partial [Defluviitaleaceae bacterium]|nr:hypothetical protein [Defluviitaleaceae bacterium]
MMKKFLLCGLLTLALMAFVAFLPTALADGGGIIPAPPPGPIPIPMIYTASDLDSLNDWLAQSGAGGGTVTLTGNIYIEAGESLNVNVSLYATVDIIAGPYAIYLNGGSLCLSGSVTLEGDSAGAPPLITDLRGSDIKIINGARVTAQGRDAISCFDNIMIKEATVSVFGDNTTALNISGALSAGDDAKSLSDIKITADGDGSAAIRSDLPLDVSLCVITADGNGAQAVIAPDMDISCSKVTPLPDGVVIVGPAADSTGNSVTIPVGCPPDQIALPGTFTCYFGPWLFTYFEVQWDTSGIDTSVEDTYTVYGTADNDTLYLSSFMTSLFSEIGLRPEAALTVTVAAVRKPAFTDSMLYYSFMRTLQLGFQDPIDPDAATLYMWDDNNGQWIDMTGGPGVTLSTSCVFIPNIAGDGSYGFKIAVSGDGLVQGESDPLWVDITDGAAIPGQGGDRTGTDRGGDAAPGTALPTPPDGSSGDGTQQDTGQQDDSGGAAAGGQQTASPTPGGSADDGTQQD